MRLNPSLLAALVLTALTACGTKTPLSLPTPAAATPAPTPAIDNTNKAAAETRP